MNNNCLDEKSTKSWAQEISLLKHTCINGSNYLTHSIFCLVYPIFFNTSFLSFFSEANKQYLSLKPPWSLHLTSTQHHWCTPWPMSHQIHHCVAPSTNVLHIESNDTQSIIQLWIVRRNQRDTQSTIVSHHPQVYFSLFLSLSYLSHTLTNIFSHIIITNKFNAPII